MTLGKLLNYQNLKVILDFKNLRLQFNSSHCFTSVMLIYHSSK